MVLLCSGQASPELKRTNHEIAMTQTGVLYGFPLESYRLRDLLCEAVSLAPFTVDNNFMTVIATDFAQ